MSRIVCRGENYDADLVLDYNSAIYRLPQGCRFLLVLARSLNLDGSPDVNEFNQDGLPSLMESYEYVMHGKCFKMQQPSAKDAKMSAAAAHYSPIAGRESRDSTVLSRAAAAALCPVLWLLSGRCS